MGSCINDSQWKIGAFLTNSYANPKKFRSRKKKIYFGLNQQPDCVVILYPDRKSSVILEADRSQIPIASLVDSTIPWESYKRINYPIPANDPILFHHPKEASLRRLPESVPRIGKACSFYVLLQQRQPLRVSAYGIKIENRPRSIQIRRSSGKTLRKEAARSRCR